MILPNLSVEAIDINNCLFLVDPKVDRTWKVEVIPQSS
jgi:hypothetical protein